MAAKFVLHKVTCAVGTGNKEYFFLANPATYEDGTVGTSCGVTEATNAEKAVEVPVSVGALIGSTRVHGLTVYGKDTGGKRYAHKVICAADKELAFVTTKIGSSYTFTGNSGVTKTMEITSIRRSRKADTY